MHLCLKRLCAKTFCAQWSLCMKLPSDSKSFLACRKAKMSWDKFRGDEKRWSMLGWDENSWEELTWMTCEKRWDEMRRAHMVWGEMKCRVRSASVKCEVQGVKRALWSVREVFAWRCIAPGSRARSRSWTASAQQLRTKHARTGLAGARRMQVL